MKAIILSIAVSFLCISASFAQLTVKATVNGVATNNTSSCTDRVITTTVTGGSGQYMYIYTKFHGEPGANITSENTPNYVINPQPVNNTKYLVTVYDLNTSTFGSTIVTALGKPLNDFNNLYWSNVFTPNGDGVNEEFYPILPAMDGNWETDSHAVAGLYRAKLQVASHDGLIFLNLDVNRSNLADSPIRYEEIYWNGRVGNASSGWVAWSGTYFYTLTLYNCNYPAGKTFKKYVMLIK